MVDGPPAPPAANAELVAFYDFDDATAIDRTGHGHHGVLSQEPPSLTAAGYEGGALSFDPQKKNCIIVPVDINPSVMPQLTMGGWFKVRTAGGQALMTHDAMSFARTLDIDGRGGPGRRWSAFTGRGVLGGEPVTTDRWTFVAMRHDQAASKLVLGVDGHQVSDKAFFGLARDWLFLGKHPKYGSYFDGAMDNVFIYKGFLSDTKIADIRAHGRAAILPASGSRPDADAGAGLRPGTVWIGPYRDMSENPGSPFSLTIQVLERHGDTVVLLAEAPAGRRKITAKLAGDRLWWNRDDVEVLEGNVSGYSASGTIRGEELTVGLLNYTTADGRFFMTGVTTYRKQ